MQEVRTGSLIEVPVLYVGDAKVWQKRHLSDLRRCLRQLNETPIWGIQGAHVSSFADANRFIQFVPQADFPMYTIVSADVPLPDGDQLLEEFQQLMKANRLAKLASHIIIEPGMRAKLSERFVAAATSLPPEQENDWLIIEQLFSEQIPPYEL